MINISTVTGELIRELDRTGANKKGSGYGGGDLTCMAEAQDIIVCGYGGMECFGVLWDLNTGNAYSQQQRK